MDIGHQEDLCMRDYIFIFKILFFMVLWPYTISNAGIISLDLCADQLLTELVPPDDFFAVTHLSRDSSLSPHKETLEKIPCHHGNIEDFILASNKIKTAIAVDHINPFLKKYFHEKNIRVIIIKMPRSLEELKKTWRYLGEQLHQKENADRLCNQLDTLQISSSSPPNREYIFYGPYGMGMGSYTIWTDILKKEGYRNALSHKKGWFYVEIEDLAVTPVQLILLLSQHMKEEALPFFQKLKQQKKVISFPMHVTLCPCIKNIQTFCHVIRSAY